MHTSSTWNSLSRCPISSSAPRNSAASLPYTPADWILAAKGPCMGILHGLMHSVGERQRVRCNPVHLHAVSLAWFEGEEAISKIKVAALVRHQRNDAALSNPPTCRLLV